MFRALRTACFAALFVASSAAAEETSPDRWPGPFGGRWNAQFTIASDYSYAGISNTQLKPAFQVGLDYSSPLLLAQGPPLWLYVTGFGSNVQFAGLPPGVELDVASGVKINSNDRKLAIDVGYQRYLYPAYPAVIGAEYGEVQGRLDYDFGPIFVSGRLRWSPDNYGHSGQSWNKRLFVSAPLSFLPVPEVAKLRAYGSLGNFWVEKPANYGIAGNDYWYWQVGLVTSIWGLDFTVAYTDTNLDYGSCGNNPYCSGRVFLSLTRAF